MTLLRFEPMKEFENMNARIQRFFEDFPEFNENREKTFAPRADISEDEKAVSLAVELPGVKKEDIKLTLEDNILTIDGKKGSPEAKEDVKYYRTERCYGDFKRSFTLPSDINSEAVEAKYENGVLFVEIKKAEKTPAKERTIELK